MYEMLEKEQDGPSRHVTLDKLHLQKRYMTSTQPSPNDQLTRVVDARKGLKTYFKDRVHERVNTTETIAMDDFGQQTQESALQSVDASPKRKVPPNISNESKLDMWNAGCLFAELLTHTPEFRKRNFTHT